MRDVKTEDGLTDEEIRWLAANGQSVTPAPLAELGVSAFDLGAMAASVPDTTEDRDCPMKMVPADKLQWREGFRAMRGVRH